MGQNARVLRIAPLRRQRGVRQCLRRNVTSVAEAILKLARPAEGILCWHGVSLKRQGLFSLTSGLHWAVIMPKVKHVGLTLHRQRRELTRNGSQSLCGAVLG